MDISPMFEGNPAILSEAMGCVLEFWHSRRKRGLIRVKALSVKAPNFKLQAPEKLQIPSFNPEAFGTSRRPFEIWCLEFLWSLEIGFWSFLPCLGLWVFGYLRRFPLRTAFSRVLPHKMRGGI